MTNAEKRDTNRAGTKKSDHEHPPWMKQRIWLVTKPDIAGDPMGWC
jgi:hypothetical protein